MVRTNLYFTLNFLTRYNTRQNNGDAVSVEGSMSDRTHPTANGSKPRHDKHLLVELE